MYACPCLSCFSVNGPNPSQETSGSRVVLVAATNRPDMLDDALMRPGRIDRKVRRNARFVSVSCVTTLTLSF